MTERYVDRDELAKLMGVSPRTISRWLEQGMPSETWGIRTRRFMPSQCMQWVRHRTHEGVRNVDVLNR